MQLNYSYQGTEQFVVVSPGALAVLQEFAAKVDDDLETVVVRPDRVAAGTGARFLHETSILAPVSMGSKPDYRLTKRGEALIICCHEQILGKATKKPEPVHNVVYTYRGVEPNILITAAAATVLDQFVPHTLGVYAFEPRYDHSEVPRATYGDMVNAGIMVNVAPDSETTMYVLTGLGRNLLQEMRHYRSLADKAARAKTNPAAWRFKHDDDLGENRVWTYTEDERLITSLDHDDYIIQKLDVRKEEE